jgi:hypothetical protein
MGDEAEGKETLEAELAQIRSNEGLMEYRALMDSIWLMVMTDHFAGLMSAQPSLG